MAKDNGDAFKEAAKLYADVRSASESYQAVKPVAEMPLIASKIAKKEGDKVAERYLLDPNTPDYAKLPFLKAGVKKQAKDLGEFVDKNFDDIVKNAPKKSLVKALTMVGNDEKFRVVSEYYQAQYPNEEDEDMRDAFIGLYGNIERALTEKYVEIATKDKDEAGIAKYILKLIPKEPEVRMNFFQALFAKEKEE